MKNNKSSPSAMLSRRKFLEVIGTGTLVLGVPTLLTNRAASAAQAQPRPAMIVEDRFGRMFPEVPPFAHGNSSLEGALMEIGRPGGIMDAKDDLERGPVDLIVDSALSANNPDNLSHTAGTTFMGQFMDHDMTFDLTSRLGEATDPEAAPNARTPSLDLDSVYGGGPIADPDLYETVKRGNTFEPETKLRIESGGSFEDVPRNGDNSAIIADPRNDENIIIAGLHAAVLLFHNRVVDLISAGDLGRISSGQKGRPTGHDIFFDARRLTTWHYQWMIVHEFLPLFIGETMVDDILGNGRKFYQTDSAFMPVEFQGAAFRFGHSMARPSYRANLAGDDTIKSKQPFFGLIFDSSQEGRDDPNDMRGGFRAPRRFIDWQTFFDFDDGEVKPNKLIDTKISTPFFNLPLATLAVPEGPTSLAQRNLLRHLTWQLPSGQALAKRMQVPALSSADLSELKDFNQNLDSSTPLWYYILKEAEIIESGRRLGPVGGRIVGEVIIGLLQLDRNSYLSFDPGWRPTLPTRTGKATGEFRMLDFLTLARVDPTSRKQ
jgi:hypothetical protein